MAETLAVRLRTQSGSDSLRRHYPHQVQGVRQRRLSHPAPPHLFF